MRAIIPRGKNTSPEKRLEVIELLARGFTSRDTEKEANVGNDVVKSIRKHYAKDIEKRELEINTSTKNKIAKIYENEITGLADRIVDKCGKILDAMTEKKLDESSLSQLALSFGICTDKMRLLTGQSTNNVAFRFNNRDKALSYIKEAIDV